LRIWRGFSLESSGIAGNDNSSRFGKYLELWFDPGGGNAVIFVY